jgi:hypothetical protein
LRANTDDAEQGKEGYATKTGGYASDHRVHHLSTSTSTSPPDADADADVARHLFALVGLKQLILSTHRRVTPWCLWLLNQ